MKILTTILFSLSLICAPLTASADKGGNKGPGDRAYEHANDNAGFKRDAGHDKHEQGKNNKKGDHSEDRDQHRDSRDHGSHDPNRSRNGSDGERSRDRDRSRDREGQ